MKLLYQNTVLVNRNSLQFDLGIMRDIISPILNTDDL